LLEVALRNNRPIPVAAYSASLRAFEDEYRIFVQGKSAGAVAPDVSLYVSRLRTGSLITEMVALAPLALPFLENAGTIIEFAGHLKTTFAWLLSKSTSDDKPSARTLQNIIDISEPVAQDGGSIMKINTVINGAVHVHLTLPSVDANAVQNVAKRHLEPIREARNAVRERVLLYLYQARSDPRSKAGDRAVIESISPSPIRVEFVNESIKREIVGGDENPFRLAYVVDVEVGTINGRPLLYKVLQVHGSIERPEAA
jgi:hypothetical protein